MRARSVSRLGEQAMPQASGASPEQRGANPILSATFLRGLEEHLRRMGARSGVYSEADLALMRG